MTPRARSGEFVPISPNPYIVGNPIKDPTMFFGRVAEFELIRRRFKLSPNDGGLMVFSGERRSGKTSILFQIRQGRLGDEFIPILIDMQAMAIENEIDFLQRIAEDTLAGLGSTVQDIPLPEFVKGSNPSSTFHRFVREVLGRYPNKKLIILIDEYELIDSKIDAGVLTEGVLHILAHLIEHEKVYLVFTGSVNLEQRGRDYWGILGPKASSKRISFLEPSDAKLLIEQPVKGQVQYDDGIVESIYRSTAGQAFYTQGVCRELIDYLNDNESNRVTQEALDEVTRVIVDNPWPQMLFRWSELSNEEKLVLALLAEFLADENKFATAEQVHGVISKGKYPLDLSFPRVAAVMEHLFETEMLIKSHVDPPAFAFRMDLWRRWVKRMHSVWQVMRELGLKLRGPSRFRKPVVAAVAVLAVALVAVGGTLALPQIMNLISPTSDEPTTDGSGSGWLQDRLKPKRGYLDVEATPAETQIRVDGRVVNLGAYQDSLGVGDHDLVFQAPGYFNDTLQVSIVAGETAAVRQTLTARTGSVRISTSPAGATLIINGTAVGESPYLATDLPVPPVHEVIATLTGYTPTQRSISVFPDSLIEVMITLGEKPFTLEIRTEPTGAEVTVTGQSFSHRDRSPMFLQGFLAGDYSLRIELEGYQTLERPQLQIDETSSPIRLTLQPIPPGALTIRGSGQTGLFYIDGGKQTGGSVGAHGPVELEHGAHKIVVQPGSGGPPISKQITIPPGKLITWYWPQDSLTTSEWTGEDP